MSPLRSTLTQRGSRLLKGKTIALRPKPLTREAPPEPISVEWPYTSTWEVRVAKALQRLAITFTPQVSYSGGVGVLGGMRVDFVLRDFNAVLRVMGPWHNFPAARSRDELQRQYLLGQGLTVIDLFEEDLEDIDAALQQKLGVPIRGAW